MDNTPQYTLVLNAAEGRIQVLVLRSQESSAPLKTGPDTGVQQANLPLPQVLCFQEWAAQSQGTEILAPVLQSTCQRLGIAPAALTRIACVNGPGSFTGLRLVLATAAGLSRVNKALCAGIPYLPLLAASALTHTHCRPDAVWVFTHARRRLVHGRQFQVSRHGSCTHTDTSGLHPRPRTDSSCACPGISGSTDNTIFPHLHALTPLLVLSIDEAVEHVAKAGSATWVLGSGVTANRELFASALSPLRKHAELLPDMHDHPNRPALLLAASRAVYLDEDISPLYARPCDAEENLPHIARKLQLDPQQAVAAFRKHTS